MTEEVKGCEFPLFHQSYPQRLGYARYLILRSKWIRSDCSLVHVARLELARFFNRLILNQLRIPISPHMQHYK